MTELQTLLLTWYTTNKRDLPWRSDQTPYRILVSELMLQQTQVPRVREKFNHWMARWPRIEDLAAAPLSDVLIEWKGLGYNRRARFLHECAKRVVSEYHGVFPNDPNLLRKLPGIGPYTQGAIRVFALGEQTTMVDTNVRRIMERLNVKPEDVLPVGHANDWHQALMDFGSLICTAHTPRCSACPLSHLCPSAFKVVEKTITKRSKKDTGKTFKETDRYFRGRIIDTLRDGKMPMLQLQTTMREQYGLSDLPRFGEIIESLMKDKLIMIEGNVVHLA